jgi:cytochrome c biogenesis protein CcdA
MLQTPKPLFQKLLSFFLGASWGFMVVGAVVTFVHTYHYGFFTALIASLFVAMIGFVFVAIFEISFIVIDNNKLLRKKLDV